MTRRNTSWFHLVAATTIAVITPECGTKAATASSAAPGRAAGRSRPNILFIMTDQQHAGMLSCAGNPHLRTPTLSALAAAGTRFERAYAANPVCVPSRFSLQTGRLPGAIGMRTNEVQRTEPREMCANSLGPLLRKAGYRCAYGGKDHTPAAWQAVCQGYQIDSCTHFAVAQGFLSWRV